MLLLCRYYTHHIRIVCKCVSLAYIIGKYHDLWCMLLVEIATISLDSTYKNSLKDTKPYYVSYNGDKGLWKMTQAGERTFILSININPLTAGAAYIRVFIFY